jgi:ribA/ribD-fused uncharacterized protein
VTIEDREMRGPTVEHLYQALKTLDLSERITILSVGTPAAAKQLGKKVTLRPDWEERKLEFMETLVREKFLQNPKLAQLLDETGDAELVEGNWWGDRFWGVCRGEGENHLGRILMRVRTELREKRQEALTEMVRHDEELGLYDDPDTLPPKWEPELEEDEKAHVEKLREEIEPLIQQRVTKYSGPWGWLDRYLDEMAVQRSSDAMRRHHLYRDVCHMPGIEDEIVRRMEEGDVHIPFFLILHDLLRFNPVPAPEAGRVPLMTQRWISWYRGRQKPEYWSALAAEGIVPVGTNVVVTEDYQSAASAHQSQAGEEAGEPEEHSGATDEVHSDSPGAGR